MFFSCHRIISHDRIYVERMFWGPPDRFSSPTEKNNCGSYGNKILYKNLDLTQDFPNKISFHFLWVKMLPKNLPKIFRWPEMCPLDKILAQDFQMAAFTKILGRRDISVVPLLSTENCKTLFHTACMAVTAMQR